MNSTEIETGISAGASNLSPALAQVAVDTAPESVDARFRTMADCAPVLLWMTGLEGLCEFFNAGWLRFTGRSLEEELGNGWAEGVHHEDFQECMHTFMSCFVRREAFSMEYRLRRHDGVYRWILDQGAPRFDESGCFTGFIGSCVDITSQREAQIALSQLNLDLGRQVHEGTALAREREEMLREVHHRVKNDLQLVASLLRMYGVQVENDAARQVLALCEERIHAIARVHEHMYQSADLTSLSFTSLLQELVDVVAGAAGPNIRVDFEAPHEVELAVDRAIPCSMIVHELLANAVQHAFPNGRAGTIKLSCHKLDEQTVSVKVVDDGVGLPSGFDGKNTLGWTLLKALARQIRSELVVREGSGTQVEVTLRGV